MLLALSLFVVVLGATVIGLVLGRRLRNLSESLRESFAVLQAALLGVVGLILAFGLALAVDRYESRREALVLEANAIGTTFLRAQTLPEPLRTRSINLLRRYVDSSIELSREVPGSDEAKATALEGGSLQRELWALAGRAIEAAPVGSAPRLYLQTLNEMIDSQAARISALNNRIPSAVLLLEVAGAALALALLAVYISILGRARVAVLLAAVLVTLLLLVTSDLDRPNRGVIRVSPGPLTDLRDSMRLPPAAAAPRPARRVR